MQANEQNCECGWLGCCLNDPSAPVGYDSQSNAFHFVGPERSQWILYFCPMCGGRFPDSNYQMDVPIAPDGEYARLQELVRELDTPDSTIAKLGNPDYDGMMKTYWNTNGEYAVDNTRSPIRNIEYYNLSEWYTIELYFDDGQIETRIKPKSLNARQLDTKFDHPELPDMPIVGDLDAELLGGGDN